MNATTILATLLGSAATLIVAVLTPLLMQGLKRLSTVVDTLPAWAKRVAVLVLAFALTHAATALGLQLSTTEVGALSPEDVSALLSAGVALLLHALKNRAQSAATKDSARRAP